LKLTEDDLRAMGRDPESGEKIGGQSDAPELPDPLYAAEAYQTVGDPLTFAVRGRPVAWERTQHFKDKRTGEIRRTNTSELREFERRVYQLTVGLAPESWDPEGFVRLSVWAHYPDMRHADLSNLIKAIEDGICAGERPTLYVDDRQVKEYGRCSVCKTSDCGEGYTVVRVDQIQEVERVE
jgi:Holliday junction resolvase RusA-like endonuclease